jgi:signal transduction histidine kinase
MSESPPSASRPSRLRVALAVVAAWTAVGLAIAEIQRLTLDEAGVAVGRAPLIGWNLWSVWLWAAFTPAIARLARDAPVERASWPRTLPLHLAAATALSALDALGNDLVAPWLFPFGDPPTLGGFFLRQLPVNLASYLVVGALAHVARYAELYRDRRLAAARLETELASARLAALQSQLQPHFLFNTLNAIAEQIHVDPHAADAMILRLGALLRSALRAPGRPEVPLRDELAITADYLELMRLRLGDRLRVRVDAPDALLDARVPALVLQPLVENAIRHGIERRSAAGLVEVRARAEAGCLVLEVRDDGAGPRASAEGGTGLGNTLARLRHLHGDAATLTLAPGEGGGAVATVRLPLYLTDAPAPRGGAPAPAAATATAPEAA